MTAVALTIAGSDSSGGAGIQADLKTFAALGVYGTSAITAVTAQNTQKVAAIHDLPADMVAAQIDAVFSDFSVGAVKTGMLASTDIVRTVAKGLARHGARNVVVDPVLAASSGDALTAADALEPLRRQLIPLALIVTPNLPEAAALTGCPLAGDERDMEAQARKILDLGARHVLLKGGHSGGADSVDLLVGQGELVRLSAKRIATKNTHGTGCTLSAAIAAELAKGRDLAAAVRAAKTYITAALAAADRLTVGHGRGPLHHFYEQWSA